MKSLSLRNCGHKIRSVHILSVCYGASRRFDICYFNRGLRDRMSSDELQITCPYQPSFGSEDT